MKIFDESKEKFYRPYKDTDEMITQSFGDSANGRSMEQLFKEFTY